MYTFVYVYIVCNGPKIALQPRFFAPCIVAEFIQDVATAKILLSWFTVGDVNNPVCQSCLSDVYTEIYKMQVVCILVFCNYLWLLHHAIIRGWWLDYVNEQLSPSKHRCFHLYSCAWHDVFISLALRVHMCDLTFSHVWNDAFVYMKWLMRTWGNTYSYVWHDSFIPVAWRIQSYDMTHSIARHVLLISVTWLCKHNRMCVVTQSYLLLRYVWHGLHKYVVSHSNVWRDSCVCDTSHSYVWHDAFIWVAGLNLIFGTRYWCVWHDQSSLRNIILA